MELTLGLLFPEILLLKPFSFGRVFFTFSLCYTFSMNFILSLDLGTTGNRAVLYRSDFSIYASAYAEFSQFFPHPGWVEQDALDIFESVKSVISRVMMGVNPAEVVVAGLTNQRETVVAWDVQTGVPICPAIVWQCRRTSERCEELNNHADEIKRKTGLPLDPYFSATKMEWVLNHVPEAKILADKGQLRFGTIDTWVMWNLTRGEVFSTDLSNASRTMLVDIHTGTYDPDLLTLFGIPEACLPKICTSDSNFGRIHPDFGVNASIMAVLGDQQSALFAQCGERVGQVKTTYGTGLFVVTPTQTAILADGLVTTVAWQRRSGRYYALEGSVFVGGSLIQWLRDQCGWLVSSADSESLAASVPDSGGVVFVPALTGLGAPYWKPNARGSIFGLTRGSTPAHIVRSALEALAFQVADVVEAFRLALPDALFSGMGVDGGASTNALLMQFQSDILGIPLQRPVNSESTSLGVAAMAAISAELCSDADFFESREISVTFEPHMSVSERQTRLDRWHLAVAQCIGFSS